MLGDHIIEMVAQHMEADRFETVSRIEAGSAAANRTG
jgi:hypothetical protein